MVVTNYGKVFRANREASWRVHRSSSDYLEIKISDYALTLKKSSSVCAVPSVPVTEVVAPKVSLQPVAPGFGTSRADKGRSRGK